MDVEQEFEGRLRDWGIGVSGPWIEEYCKSHPLDQKARGYLVFSHALEKRDGAREEAEAVLAVSPDDESALAALFLLVEPLREEHENRFVNENGARLGPHWIAIFTVLGLRDKAEQVYIVNLINGSPRQVADVCFIYQDFHLTEDGSRKEMTEEELLKEAEEILKNAGEDFD